MRYDIIIMIFIVTHLHLGQTHLRFQIPLQVFIDGVSVCIITHSITDT